MGVILNTQLDLASRKRLTGFIRKKREQSGMTQAELAAKHGRDPSFVAKIESGEGCIDVFEFLALARILAFDPLAALIRCSMEEPDASRPTWPPSDCATRMSGRQTADADGPEPERRRSPRHRGRSRRG